MRNNEGLSTLPMGWTSAKLGEVLIKSDERFDPKSPSNRRFVGLEHIEGNTGRLLGFGKSSETRSTKTVFCRGDLLYGKLRPYLNKVWVADFDGVCSTDILVFKHTQFLHSKFLACRLLGSDFVRYASQGMSGVQHPRVSYQRISDFAIAFPPLEEQHRIVSKVEELFTKLDAGVKSLETAKTQLKSYRQSVLKSAFDGKLTEEWRRTHRDELEPAFKLLEQIREERRRSTATEYRELPPVDMTGLPELPEGWTWTRLGEIALIMDVDHKMPRSVEKDGVPFISPKNFVNQDDIDFANAKHISVEDFERLSRKCKPEIGDVLYSRIGTIGKARRAPDKRFQISYSLCIVRPSPSLQATDICVWLLRSPFVLSQALANTRSIGVPDLGLNDINRFVVPIAPLDEQHKIVEEIERHSSIADEVEKTVVSSVGQSEKLRQSVLKQAFVGKLVPQDLGDEPASILLEQIKSLKIQVEQDQRAKKRRKRNDPRQRRLM